MEPTLSFSDRFSQCSLDQMRPQIGAAACIVPAQYADVTVEIPEPIRALIGQPFDYVIDVRSQGNQAAIGVAVQISPLGSFTIHSASAEGGTCSQNPPGSVTCQLGDLPGGTRRRVTLRLTVDFFVGTFQTSATTSSANDRIPANDTVAVPIFVGSLADVSVSVTPTSISSPTRQVHAFTATVTSHGPLAAENVWVIFQGSFKMQPEAASSPGADCVPSGCSFGTLAPGESRDVIFTARGVQAGAFNAEFEAIASNDDVSTNDKVLVPVVLTAISDAALGPGGTMTVVINEPFSLLVPVTSVGQEAVEGVEVQTSVSSGLVFESATVPGGTCVILGAGSGFLRCTLEPLPPGTTRIVDARLRGTEVVNDRLRVQITSSTNDEDPANNNSTTIVRVRHFADIDASADPYFFPELLPSIVRVALRSAGMNPAADITATITVPASITLVAASLAEGTCTIAGTTVTCSLASLAPDAAAFIDLTVQGATTGAFVGSVTVDSSNDTNDTNDVAELRFNVSPYIDAALDAPSSVTGHPNETVVVPLTVATLNQPVNGVRLHAEGIAQIIESVTTSVGSCTVTESTFHSSFDCVLGALAARSTVTVTLRVRSLQPAGFTMRAELAMEQDFDQSNNTRQVLVRIDRPPDAMFEPGPIELVAQVNRDFNAQINVTVFGLPGLTDLVVTIPVPSAITALTAFANDGGTCVMAAAAVTCTWAESPGGGILRFMTITMRATATGRFPTTLTLAAANDSDPINNSVSLTYVINEPPPPGSGGGGGGGGGGGALSVHLLLGLVLVVLTAPSRRRRPT
jgi:hypothetical protein